MTTGLAITFPFFCVTYDSWMDFLAFLGTIPHMCKSRSRSAFSVSLRFTRISDSLTVMIGPHLLDHVRTPAMGTPNFGKCWTAWMTVDRSPHWAPGVSASKLAIVMPSLTPLQIDDLGRGPRNVVAISTATSSSSHLPCFVSSPVTF